MDEPVLDSHFHCPDCGPLVYGQTRAICGRIIPAPVVGTGSARKCPDCKSSVRSHRRDHH